MYGSQAYAVPWLRQSKRKVVLKLASSNGSPLVNNAAQLNFISSLRYFGVILLQTDLSTSLLHVEKSFLATVAIDFGTTFSGFAFSFNKDDGKDVIFMNRAWMNDQGHQTSKTPTCLLLEPDLSFHSFGYEAEEKYANLTSISEEKEYMFFRHFKMLLHNDEVRGLLNSRIS